MVGAIADWFAVTALFKHPLGLPIPHTALIPKRKEMLGRSLEEFVGENFLQEQVIRERMQVAELSRRVGEWLTVEHNARRVVDEAAVGAPHRAVPGARRGPRGARRGGAAARGSSPSRSARWPAACWSEVVRDKAHHGLVDLALDEAHRWLSAEREHLQRDRRRAGALVVAARHQRPGDPPAAPGARRLARRHPRRPAPPRPDRARRHAGPARPGPAARPRHPGARRAAQGAGPRPPADPGHRDLAVERLPRRPARRPRRRSTARCAGAGSPSSTRSPQRLLPTPPCAPSSTARRPTSRSSSSGGTATS